MEKLSPVIYIILALSVLLFLLAKFNNGSGKSDTILLITKYTSFSLLCLAEIYYFVYVNDGMWFFNYEEIGWVKTILSFIILCLVLSNQFQALTGILFHLHQSDRPADFRIGFYSYIYGFLGIFVCFLIDESDIGVYGIIAIFLFQLIQLGFIFYNNRPYWKYSIASAVIYLLGTITLIVALFYFWKPILFACFVFIVLWLFSFIFSNTIRVKIER